MENVNNSKTRRTEKKELTVNKIHHFLWMKY